MVKILKYSLTPMLLLRGTPFSAACSKAVLPSLGTPALHCPAAFTLEGLLG